MKIRKPTKKDLEELSDLVLQFWEVHKNLDPLIEPKKKETKQDRIKGFLEFSKRKNHFLYVAVEEKIVVGYTEFYIKDNDKFFKVRRFGYMDTIVVHKDFRRKGIGKELTKFVLDFLKKKGIKYVRANVYNKNETALKVWKKAGFEFQSTQLFKKIA